MTAEAASTQHQADWSPSAIDPEAGPYETLAALRESCPAAWTDEGHGYWTVTRYADIVAMARDTETFSNVPRHPRIGTMYTPPLEADRPRHTPFRRALNPFFKRDYLTAKEGMVRELAVEMIQPLLEAGTADYSQQLCQPMPAIVLCRLIGMPDDDWRQLRTWTETSFRSHRDRDNDPEAFRQANEQINRYGRQLINRAKAENHRQDIVTALLNSEIAETQFSDAEVFGLVRLLLQAGHTTTSMSMANVLYNIARDEGLQGELRKNRTLIPAAIAEVLRMDTPVLANIRRVTKDTEVHGRPLKKDDHVLLSWAAANHDEAAFDHPDTVDLTRDTRTSLTFGHGIHKCPGMPLALLQIKVVIEELLARTDWLELAGPVERKVWEANGVRVLPLRTVTDPSSTASPLA